MSAASEAQGGEEGVIHPRNQGGPESGFVETWADRKARRAAQKISRSPLAPRDRPVKCPTPAQLERETRAAQRAKSDEAERRRAAEVERRRAERALADAAWAAGGAHPATRILHEVAQKHGLAVADLTGPSRRHAIVYPRMEAMWRMRMETSLSLPEIGRRVGGKHHTTVMYGVRWHQWRFDSEWARQIEAAP